MTEPAAGGLPPRRFRPTLWATLCTLLSLAILIALGTWQLQRLEWKEALIAERQAQVAAAPVALPDAIADPEAIELVKVAVRGRFLHGQEFYLGGRTSASGAVGVHVVTPLVLDDGRVLLVDRGWVPMAARDPAARPEGQVDGNVAVEGLLRRDGWKGSHWFQPANDPEDNYWHYMDIPAMAEWADLERVVPVVYLEAGPAANPGGLPRGGQSAITLNNPHLEYAMTWYALALVLLIIYILFSLRRKETGRQP